MTDSTFLRSFGYVLLVAILSQSSSGQESRKTEEASDGERIRMAYDIELTEQDNETVARLRVTIENMQSRPVLIGKQLRLVCRTVQTLPDNVVRGKSVVAATQWPGSESETNRTEFVWLYASPEPLSGDDYGHRTTCTAVLPVDASLMATGEIRLRNVTAAVTLVKYDGTKKELKQSVVTVDVPQSHGRARGDARRGKGPSLKSDYGSR
jgi:hypothetical protein